MKKSPLTYRVAAALILIFVFAFSVRRARIQPIAHDEALTFVGFLSGPMNQVFQFEANNHFLFTLLAKVSVKALGLSEFSLRLPSLLAAMAYLTFSYFLCLQLFGDTILLPLTCALLSLNPLLMEFLAAARGYGLGIACLAGTAYFMVLLLQKGSFDPADARSRRLCAIASVLLALSVAANLANLIAAFSLTVCFAAAIFWPSWDSPRKAQREESSAVIGELRLNPLSALLRWILIPGSLVGLFILWPFLIQARRSASFDFGYDRFGEWVQENFTAWFLSKWTSDSFADLSARPMLPGTWQFQVTHLGMLVLFPAVVFLLILGLVLLLRPVSRISSASRAALLFGGSALLWMITVVLLHWTMHMKYPVTRTCLSAVLTVTLGSVLVGREVLSRYPVFLLRPAGLLLIAALIVDYAASLNSAYFRYNAYDSISREIFLAVSHDATSRSVAGARVGGTWWYRPEWDFYRLRYHDERFSPYDVKDRSHPLSNAQNSLQPADYDYFVYTPANAPDLAGYPVRIIYTDANRRATIAQIDQPKASDMLKPNCESTTR